MLRGVGHFVDISYGGKQTEPGKSRGAIEHDFVSVTTLQVNLKKIPDYSKIVVQPGRHRPAKAKFISKGYTIQF